MRGKFIRQFFDVRGNSTGRIVIFIIFVNGCFRFLMPILDNFKEFIMTVIILLSFRYDNFYQHKFNVEINTIMKLFENLLSYNIMVKQI